MKQRPEKPYLRALYRGNRLLWTVVMGLEIIDVAVNLTISWLLKEATDVITTGDLLWLKKLLLISLVILVPGQILTVLRCRLRARFRKRAMEQYKAFVFDRLTRKSIAAFSRENSARYISVLTADVQTIEEDYLCSAFSVVHWLLTGIGAMVMIVYYGSILAWGCIGMSLVTVAVSVPLSGEMSRRTKAVSDQNEHFVARIKDLLAGFPVLKSFKAEKEAVGLFGEENRKTEEVKEKCNWWGSILGITQGTCGMLLQFGVLLGGAWLAILGRVSPGTAIGLVNLTGQLRNPIENLPEVFGNWKAGRGLVEKMARIGEENGAHTGERIAPELKDAITLDQVSFAYEEGKPVLRDISLRLEAGKRYAIVGASGSGKSTLLNLLMGGCDGYSGEICLDGKELKTVDPDSLYDMVSLIGQNVFLFDNSIRENITLFREFPAEAVESAVVRSGLRQVIDLKGEEYRCGENGNGLSGGERQRVSIARSLLRGTPVLMLDEATAALDNQTAFEVTQSILNLEGLTRIVVTHRLDEPLLRQYDEILVLRDGRISEQGSFGELMDSMGYFYSLYRVTNG